MERNDFLKLIATETTMIFANLSVFGDTRREEKITSKILSDTFSSKDSEVQEIGPQLICNSIDDLKKIEPSSLEIKGDTQIKLLGHYEPDDGGGGFFYWDSDATQDDNNGTVVKPEFDKFQKLGRWKRLINEDQINVKKFGARGDGSGIDDQPAIQKAINYASENDIEKVIIPKGDYTVDLNITEIRDTYLSLKDNIHMRMADDTILRLSKGESKVEYNMLSVVNRENVIIEGGTIIGNKLTRSGKPEGEHGMGIALVSCKNVTIRETTLKEQWGDGIYIGRYGGEESKCQNIVIKGTTCDDNRRQGMSVISVNGLKVNNCEFNNTGGTRPEAGIDFEPNNPDEILQNISLKNIQCKSNSGSGILFVLSNLESPNEPKITINTEGAYIENSAKTGIAITKHFNVPGRGDINFENITVKNNGSRAAYYVRNWHKNAPRITFKNIIAINPNTSGQGGTTQGSALVFFDNDPGYDKGNLHIDGFRAKKDTSDTGKAPKDIYVNKDVWNCSFRNIESSINNLNSINLLDKKKNNKIDSILNS